jgi:glycosyltransferase involved in cell wall biosynthesis
VYHDIIRKTTGALLKISFSGLAMRYMDLSVGYGQAAYNIFNSFKKLGTDCSIDSLDCDIEICFTDPRNVEFLTKDSYKIAYIAWESTDMTSEMKKKISPADELWATSPWTANVFKNLFPDKPVFVYKHGINKMWKPKLRKKPNKPFTFFHIGEPFSRKEGQMVSECFIELFGQDPNYRLVLKSNGMNTIKVKHPDYGFLTSPAAGYANIVSIDAVLTDEQMVGLYGLCDVFIYPSWGEGWGLQPMQALALGMPVISTAEWADYKKYITFPVKSSYRQSPWQQTHPGMMTKPDIDSLRKQMLNAVANYEKVLPQTFKNAFEIHEEYDWLEVTKPVVARLQKIYNSLS